MAQKLSVDDIVQKQYKTQKTAMGILGSWAVINIGTGIYGSFQYEGEAMYFHQFDAMWNSVNLAIAGFSYFSAKKILVNNSLQKAWDRQVKLEKTLLLNIGLDAAYITGGLLLKQIAKSASNPNLYNGYGNSLIMQGAFLLLFDIGFYMFQHKTYKPLKSQIFIQE